MSGINEQFFGIKVKKPADGAAGSDASGAGLVLLETQTAASDTSVDFITGIDSTYDEYVFSIIDLKVATDAVNFQMEYTTNGGSTWAVANVDYGNIQLVRGGTPAGVSSAAGSAGLLNGSDNLGNNTNEKYNGKVRLFKPSATNYVHSTHQGIYNNPAGEAVQCVGGNINLSTSAINGIRFRASSGNIASGELKLYGVQKTV